VRTTVDIPDALYRRLKSSAAEQGCSVKELIMRGVESQLDNRNRSNRVRLPIVRSKRSGALHLTNERIYEIIPFP
jgi:predicted DNA-binding ribbon-helix-helix protein